jgi:hypothetical protein
MVDGIKFQSLLEAGRYMELRLLERAGEIVGLELQPKYNIQVNGQHICQYRADFRYKDRNGKVVVEDAKGYMTPMYSVKKKLLKAVYGIEIVEIRGER